MKHYDVSRDDNMVVDKDGAIWRYDRAGWQYLADDGWATWDTRDELPAEYEPYVRLDGAAQSRITAAMWKESV